MSEPATIEPASSPTSTPPARRASAALWQSPAIQLLALVALAAAIFFFHLGSYGLWEPDEARYAEIAREMLASGNFLVPHLNYVPYIEKPPLLYWLEAMWMALLGVNEFAARLTPALSALAGVVATWFFVRRTMDPARALLAGAILATSMMYAEMAQVVTTDMLLAATITVALFSLYLHSREGGRWCWLAYVAIALGTLTKGPIAGAIPVLALAIFLWWEGELRGVLRRFHVFWGGLIVLAIAGPWFVAITVKLPSFFDFFFVGEYLRRFFQKSYSHHHAFYYYVPVMLGGLMPWTLIAPFIAWRKLGRTSAGRFCIISAAVVLGLFSAASAKLIPYVLPAFAPIAVLLADGILTRASGADSRASASAAASAPRSFVLIGLMISLLGAGAIAVALLTPLFKNPYLSRTQPALYAVGLIGVIGGALVGELFRRARAEAGLAAMVLVTVLALCAGSYGRLEAEPLRSYATLAREVAARAPDATLICYPRYVQGLPFYTHRRVILVGPKTELAFGAAHSPGADHYFFNSQADVLRLWNRPGPVVLVTGKRELRRLGPLLGNYAVIGSEWHKRAILKVREKVREPRYAS